MQPAPVTMEFVGSIVSLSCGDVLGTYQGKLIQVNNSTQMVTIDKPFRNGMQCSVPTVTINAGDIHDLKIIKAPQEASTLPEVRHQHVSVTTVADLTPSHPAPLNCHSSTTVTESQSSTTTQRGTMCSAAGTPKKSGDLNSKNSNSKQSSCRSPSSYNAYSTNTTSSPVRPPKSPSKGFLYDNSYAHQNGSTNSCGSSLKNHRQNYDNNRPRQGVSPMRSDDIGHGTGRPRKDSFTDNQMVTKRGYSTPRKPDSRKKTPREDCFSEPVDTFISEEFDFEKNLALFDKQAVFEEIESQGYPKITRGGGGCGGQYQELKYKNDENVIPSRPAVFDQITVPGVFNKEFVTDQGLVVPSIGHDMRNKLLEVAEEAGYNLERQIETVGRSAAEMVLQLIGGNHRLVPQNAHQPPSVVVLCGPHIQGTQAVNCARHLAAHNVRVTLYLPNFVKVLQELQQELRLFELCDGVKTASVKDLPSLPVDLIVTALDSHDNKCSREQAWYQRVVDWTNQNKAPVLGIDPPVEGGAIDMKWSLSMALPLALNDRCGQVYLCDLSLPSKLYKTVGIKYESPFANKFVIPLHKS